MAYKVGHVVFNLKRGQEGVITLVHQTSAKFDVKCGPNTDTLRENDFRLMQELFPKSTSPVSFTKREKDVAKTARKAAVVEAKAARKLAKEQASILARALAIENGFAMHLPKGEYVREIVPEHNPEAFNTLEDYGFRNTAILTLSAPPSKAEAYSLEMRNFVIPCAKETSHDLKCNVAVQNSRQLGDLQKILKFQVWTNGWTNGFGEVEICSKALALALGVRGIISERVLCKPDTEEGTNNE